MSKFSCKDKDKLKEQLKFFKAKKQQFISVYAKKPRIRVEVKRDEYKSHSPYDIWSRERKHRDNIREAQADIRYAGDAYIIANMRNSQASALSGIAGRSSSQINESIARGQQCGDVSNIIGYNAIGMGQASSFCNVGKPALRRIIGL